jgi:manganese efflux pump family protein
VTFPSILLLAVGLAMDAAAVSAARGAAAREIRARHVAMVALFFGGFQAAMPLLGATLGGKLGPLVEAWDHWIAFVLLGGIGLNMLRQSWRSAGGAEAPATGDPFGAKVMLLLAIATSIDALAVGVTLPMLGAPLPLTLVTIGIVTAALSALGLAAGRRFGALLGRRFEAVGGVVLVVLGAKILVQHLHLL